MKATSEWQGQFRECLSEGVEAQRRAQYVAYQNPNPTTREQFPYLLDIQSSQLASPTQHGYFGWSCALTNFPQELKMSRAALQSCEGSVVVFGPELHTLGSCDQ